MESGVHPARKVLAAALACVAAGLSFASNEVDDVAPMQRTSSPPACASDLLYETFELGAEGWTHAPISGEPLEDSWHLASTSCEGDDLGSTMYVSDGNCTSGWGLERSKLLSPPVSLPAAAPIHLVFDAVAFDEGGECLNNAPFQYDLKDAGITLNGGGNWVILNDCYPLTPKAVDWGVFVRREFDISAFVGQTVQVVFAYDTVDADVGHTFAVDSVRIVQGDFDEDGVGADCDCQPLDGAVWDLPGEALNLQLSHAPFGSLGTTSLDWNAPATGGLQEAMLYDVIRSLNPADFTTGSVCVESDGGPDTTAEDGDAPDPGEVYFYRVRAQNLCGEGIVGTDSNDVPQPARSCP